MANRLQISTSAMGLSIAKFGKMLGFTLLIISNVHSKTASNIRGTSSNTLL